MGNVILCSSLCLLFKVIVKFSLSQKIVFSQIDIYKILHNIESLPLGQLYSSKNI